MGIGQGTRWQRRQVLRASIGSMAGVVLPGVRAAEAAPALFGVGRAAAPPDALAHALQAAGGLARYVSPGDSVLIKAGVTRARPPASGVNTSPGLLTGLIRAIRHAGARRVIVTDVPLDPAASAFAQSGIADAVETAGAELWLPLSRDFSAATGASAAGIRGYPLLSPASVGADRVVSVAPVTDHRLCGAAMALAAQTGWLGATRTALDGCLHAAIAGVARVAPPALHVLDGTRVMMANGPAGGVAGLLWAANTVVVATDPAAADLWAWRHLLLRREQTLPHYLVDVRAAT